MKARLFTLLAALGLLATVACAETASEIRARMAQRLPAVDAFKAKGVIGENNRGFVEVRASGTAAASALVTDENRDREAVYALIAKGAGTTPDSVGRARAKQIAASSLPGVLVQDDSGTWKKK